MNFNGGCLESPEGAEAGGRENQRREKMSVISMKQLLEAGVHSDIRQEDGTLKWHHTSTQKEMVSTSSTYRNL